MTVPSATRFTQQSNVRMYGQAGPALLFGHGFCTDSDVFQHQVADLSCDHRVITYDLAGFGQSDPGIWSAQRHATLEGYAQDLVRLLDELDLQDVTLVGASMSAMISLLASLERPWRVRALVFVAASPRYLNDRYYKGGFDRADIDAFYAGINSFEAWTQGVAG